MVIKRSFWINLCLINLCIVALLGFTLRSKILFSLPFLDYRNFLSAHSHFAFAGWAGLSLITLLIHNLLPPELAQKKKYQGTLWGIAVSALGMALTFPVLGYNVLSILFSSLYIFVTFYFAPVFIKDLLRYPADKTVRLLSISAIASLIVSAIGPLGLAYILIAKSGNTILYRDSIYTFLHFQYNGFFTLAVFALFVNHLAQKGIALSVQARRFALFLCLSVPPALFLSLLWQGSAVFYGIAAVACLFMLVSLFYFIAWLRQLNAAKLFKEPIARTSWRLAAFSFCLKMFLNVGTVYPALGQAVYGDRPVIIGFLHLVFLGFLTFFLLAMLVEYGYFKKLSGTVKYPFVVFATGIIVNELLLGLQGFGILFQTTTFVFNWLLWGSSILLFAGALLLAFERFRSSRNEVAYIQKP